MAWRAEKIWPGQTCFIIGGGPSVLGQDLTLLQGQHVIVINSSYLTYPAAEFCIFGDMRWWNEHCKPKPGRPQSLLDFKGKIIGTSSAASGPPPLCKMIRVSHPGLADEPDRLMLKQTTLTAAINLAVHCGVNKIVLLGIDGKPDAQGRTHHHFPHPAAWVRPKDCWKRQHSDLVKIAAQLVERNIVCVNASPGSAWDLWPIVELADHVSRQAVAA